MNEDYNKDNDPKGNVYFYFNDIKKKAFIVIHIDKKTKIDRPAKDSEKVKYKDQWSEFNKSRSKK